MEEKKISEVVGKHSLIGVRKGPTFGYFIERIVLYLILSFVIVTLITLTYRISDSEKYVFKEKVNIESLETSGAVGGHFVMGFG